VADCVILKVLMARLHILKSESGFTLVELIIVMAISGSLLSIAFVGQRALRSRAQFDATVEKVVSTVSSARTQAVAGVNISSTATVGTGVDKCVGGQPLSTVNPVVFAGTSWTIDSTGSNTVFTIDSYKARPGLASPADACVFDTEAIGLPTDVQLSAPAANVGKISGMLFVRTNTGGLEVCPAAARGSSNAYENNVRNFFQNATCANGALSLTLKDLDGHTADIRIDTSGLAQRLN
jgi:prepilin-type N-terminal cleavage/methylation domain-containing protein